MNLLTGSMTPEQFQQYQQEQQQAFFRWQQSQILNRDLDDLQQNSPSFHSESSQTLTQPQQVDSPKKGGRKKTKARRGKNVEDEPQEPVAAGRWLPELRLKREAAERAFEAQAEKDRTLMRLEELRFLATSTKDLDEDDAYWIKKQKKLIKNKMKNDLGDEDDEDEDE
ncbi:hypothetical protein Tco_0876653 [Tanacetum coccineum]|uniref:No apical meristem-associated C-terminal domain-containing protein n=1 Tax=Tanacetum coccineum TaxID=301880 RepID=A0ABQ5BVM1_9ASTR